MKNSKALSAVASAEVSIQQAIDMMSDIPHIANQDRALNYITDGMRKLAEAIEALASE